MKKHIANVEECYRYLYENERTVGKQYVDDLNRVSNKLLTITSKMIKQRKSDNSTIALQKKIFENMTVYSDQHIEFCYMCRKKMFKQHKHYKHMCPLCGHINWAKRNVKKDYTGKNAVVTGGRIKIGFETAIRLLHCGCNVIISTRFANDALSRYMAEDDYDDWKDRLHIVQVNFLSISSVEKFIRYIADTFDRLDFLINNAAQTIRRAAEFYKNEVEKKIDDPHGNIKMIIDTDLKIPTLADIHRDMKAIANKGKATPDEKIEETSVDVSKIFPPGKLDEFGQQIDLNPVNTWVLEIGEIDIKEVAEVHLINSIIPFAIISTLKPLMVRDGKDFTWIINVSSMEGCFNRTKSTGHPHTNMAKASLNMMTRTAAGTLIKDHIVLCSVDTGWNNNQMPCSYGTVTPVDCVDGAARILDPIFRELKKPGIFYKDYKEHNW